MRWAVLITRDDAFASLDQMLLHIFFSTAVLFVASSEKCCTAWSYSGLLLLVIFEISFYQKFQSLQSIKNHDLLMTISVRSISCMSQSWRFDTGAIFKRVLIGTSFLLSWLCWTLFSVYDRSSPFLLFPSSLSPFVFSFFCSVPQFVLKRFVIRGSLISIFAWMKILCLYFYFVYLILVVS